MQVARIHLSCGEKLLTNQPRMKALLELVAEKAKWGSPLPKGRGRGIATHFSFDSYVAQVAEVSVDTNGECTSTKLSALLIVAA